MSARTGSSAKGNSLLRRLEKLLVEQNGKQVEQIDCVIQAIYKLSFNHHLKRNGLALSNLDKSNQMAHFRQLHTWPSQSRFVFSLAQMRDAYATLGRNKLAPQFMSERQIAESQKRNKLKREFWSLLGEAPTAAESFHLLSQDQKTSAEELQRLRTLARAFRLVLFQKKITQYKETGNFLALLKSANRQLAREAFANCVGIVPFPEHFLAGDDDDDDDKVAQDTTDDDDEEITIGADEKEETIVDDQDQQEQEDTEDKDQQIGQREKDEKVEKKRTTENRQLRRDLKQCKERNESLLATLAATIDDLRNVRLQARQISSAIEGALRQLQLACPPKDAGVLNSAAGATTASVTTADATTASVTTASATTASATTAGTTTVAGTAETNGSDFSPQRQHKEQILTERNDSEQEQREKTLLHLL